MKTTTTKTTCETVIRETLDDVHIDDGTNQAFDDVCRSLDNAWRAEIARCYISKESLFHLLHTLDAVEFKSAIGRVVDTNSGRRW